MKRSTVLVFLFGLFLGGCGSSRQGGEEAEVVRHYECLLRALATDDSLTLRREQHYVTDTLSSDVFFAFSHRHKYLYSWTDSYIFYNMMMKAGKAEVTTKLATYRFCRDVKRLAARMLDAGKEKQLEEMLRIVATLLQEHGMNDAAAVTAAAVMGIDVDPACPGDIARRLLTRLLLAGKKAPRLSHTVPLVASGPTLLLFYETDCPNCEAVLRDLCGFYTTLKDRGVRVLSIASDEDEHIFSSRAASLPWTEKWYDSRGFYSPDFENYGVASTPTLVVVNPDGRIAGSYHTLEETGLISIP